MFGQVIYESPNGDGSTYQETVIGVSTNHIRVVKCHTEDYVHLYRIETDDSFVGPYAHTTAYDIKSANNWFYSMVKFPPTSR